MPTYGHFQQERPISQPQPQIEESGDEKSYQVSGIHVCDGLSWNMHIHYFFTKAKNAFGYRYIHRAFNSASLPLTSFSTMALVRLDP